MENKGKTKPHQIRKMEDGKQSQKTKTKHSILQHGKTKEKTKLKQKGKGTTKLKQN